MLLLKMTNSCLSQNLSIHLMIILEMLYTYLHNTIMSDRRDGESIPIVSLDQIPKGVHNCISEKVLTFSQSNTAGLAYNLNIKVGATVVLTLIAQWPNWYYN